MNDDFRRNVFRSKMEILDHNGMEDGSMTLESRYFNARIWSGG